MESSTNVLRPPVLDGKNYAYWKVRVKAYIKSIDERVWRSILTGWTPPVTTNAETRVETVKLDKIGPPKKIIWLIIILKHLMLFLLLLMLINLN